MRFKFLGLLLLTTLTLTSHSQERIFEGTFKNTHSVNTEKKVDNNIKEFNKVKRITPTNGMMPVFEESIISDQELVKEVLDITGYSSSLNNGSSSDNNKDNFVNDENQKQGFEIISNNYSFDQDHFIEVVPDDTIEILLTERITNYSKMEYLEEKIKKYSSDNKEVPDELVQEYTKTSENVSNSDSKIYSMIEQGADKAINKIIGFVASKVKKGDLIAITAVVSGIREYIETKPNYEENEDLIKLVTFLDKVEKTSLSMVALLEENDTFKKYYLLYNLINNIFIQEYKDTLVYSQDSEPNEDSDDDKHIYNNISIENTDSEPENNVSEQQENTTPVNEDNENYRISKNIRFDRLIENFEFVEETAMTVQQIQRFLESKGSCLKNMYRGQYPSQIIFNVCKKMNINPKIVLATIQKEQSLVSRKSASAYKLDWALGVGCYDNGTRNSKFKGLERQLASAIKIYRHWYDDGLDKNISQNGFRMRVNYNTSYQYMENESTYALYRYTPHTVDIRLNVRGGGNYLFAKIYNSYFGGFKRK